MVVECLHVIAQCSVWTSIYLLLCPAVQFGDVAMFWCRCYVVVPWCVVWFYDAIVAVIAMFMACRGGIVVLGLHVPKMR
jgi:hypothetical protein